MNKLGSYITKLMTTILDSEQEEFVKTLALSELRRLNVDVNDFIRKHILEFVRLHPRTDCLETPVNVTKNDPDDYYYRTKIEVDESRQVG